MYTPHRDERFDYIWELMEFIEETQCGTCAFKSDRFENPMCFEIEAEIIDEKPVADLDDKGSDGVECTRYRNDDLHEQAHADQGRLFNE